MSSVVEAAQHPWPALGVLLLRDGLVTKDDLNAILDGQRDSRQQRITGTRLGEILVERGVVNALQVARLLAEQYELPFMELEPSAVDTRVARAFTLEQSSRFAAVPIGMRPDGSYDIAIADPSTVVFSDEVRALLGSVPHFVVVGHDAVREAVDRAHASPDTFEAGPAPSADIVDFPQPDTPGEPLQQSSTLAPAWPPLGALLVRDGIVSDDELESALAQQRLSTSHRLGEILVDRGVVSSATVARLVAEQYELPFARLSELDVDPEVARLLPHEIARSYHAVPVRRNEDGSLDVAIADPTNVFYSDELHTQLNAPLAFVVAPPDEIEALVEAVYRSETGAHAEDAPLDEAPAAYVAEEQVAPAHVEVHLEVVEETTPESVWDVAEEHTAAVEETTREGVLDVVEERTAAVEETTPEGVVDVAEESTDSVEETTPEGVVDVVEEPAPENEADVFVDAEAPDVEGGAAPPFEYDATGVAAVALSLAEPREETAAAELEEEPVTLTVELVEREPGELDLERAVLQALDSGASVLHLSQHDDVVDLRARTGGSLESLGSFAAAALPSVAGELAANPDLELSSQPTARGTKLTATRVDRPFVPTRLSELGLTQLAEQTLRDSLAHPGLVIVTGPPGCGLTTTLHAALESLIHPDRAVATVEDTLERPFAGADQTKLGDTGVTSYAEGILRHWGMDADVIFVSDLPDVEAVTAALRCGLADRHVLAGMTETDAAHAAARVRDAVAGADRLGTAVSCVAAQRLVQLVCDNCRETYYASPSELAELGFDVDGSHRLLARGRGCRLCNGTGYRGRTAAFEVVPAATSHGLHAPHVSPESELPASSGVATIRDEIVRLCLEGLTTTDELDRLSRTLA